MQAGAVLASANEKPPGFAPFHPQAPCWALRKHQQRPRIGFGDPPCYPEHHFPSWFFFLAGIYSAAGKMTPVNDFRPGESSFSPFWAFISGGVDGKQNSPRCLRALFSAQTFLFLSEFGPFRKMGSNGPKETIGNHCWEKQKGICCPPLGARNPSFGDAFFPFPPRRDSNFGSDLQPKEGKPPRMGYKKP